MKQSVLKWRIRWGDLIVHHLIYRRTEWIDKEMIDLVLYEGNSLLKGNGSCTALHYACLSSELNMVKLVVDKGGYNEFEGYDGLKWETASSLTKNKKN